MPPRGSIRIGVDAGSAVTHGVGIRTTDSAVFYAEAPSTPENPSQASGLVIKNLLDQAELSPSEMAVLVFASTAPANALLRGESLRLGLIVNTGYREILEAGNQGIPEGTSAPYLWVKPPRTVPLDRVIEVGGRIGPDGSEREAADEESIRRAVQRLKALDAEAVGVCLLHAPMNPSHERRVREVFAAEFPECPVSLSSDTGSESMEYERAETVLMDAACKVLLQRAIGGAAERAAKAMSEDSSFLAMKSDGAAMSAREALEHPLPTLLAGSAAGALAGATLARSAGISRAITFHAGASSTHVSLSEDGAVPEAASLRLGGKTIASPGLDIVSAPIGGCSFVSLTRTKTLALGPGSAGAQPGPVCLGQGGETPTLADALAHLGWLPNHAPGAEAAFEGGLAREAIEKISALAENPPDATAREIIAQAARRQAGAICDLTSRRGKNPSGYSLIAFGGLGPLMACEVASELGIREVVVPPRPASSGAEGLVSSDRQNHYTMSQAAGLDGADPGDLEPLFEELEQTAQKDFDTEGVPADSWVFLRAADMRYQGETWRATIELPPGLPFAESMNSAIAAFREAHRYQFSHNNRSDAKIEIVLLRLTALGKLGHEPTANGGESGAEAHQAARQAKLGGDAFSDVIVYSRSGLRTEEPITGPAFIDEPGATTLVPAGATCGLDENANLRIKLSAHDGAAHISAGMIGEAVEGALITAEREMEHQFRQAASSLFIRELGVARAALFDQNGRKLTGRAFSPPVTPLLRAFPMDEIHDGDVFFWNDAYLPGGGMGRLVEPCCCIPVFHRGALCALALLAGHQEDLGGVSPGSLPVSATQIFHEGVLIPPIKLYEAGVMNRSVQRIITRNSRRSEDAERDIAAQVAACRIGARQMAELFERHGPDVVFASFDSLIERCNRSTADELLSHIPEGSYAWEDYVESDGVDTHKVHPLKLKVTKKKGARRLALDFRGTAPQARGAINLPVNRDGGTLLKLWLSAALHGLQVNSQEFRDFGMNAGVIPLLDVQFPEAGTLITPTFPAASHMSSLTLARLRSLFTGILGIATQGKAPADQELLHWWGLRGRDHDGRFFQFRECLGGGTGARSWSDGENALLGSPGYESLQAEFIEAHYPIEILYSGLAIDSGGPGKRRGGLGFARNFRVHCDCEVLSHADRGFLAPWGAVGGRAGGRFRIIVNPGSAVEREVPALSAGVHIMEGDIVRIETTGGGGWGDPLEREMEIMRADVEAGRVSVDSSMRHYGVVFSADDPPRLDPQGTAALRSFMRSKRGKPSFFDRGPNAAVVRQSLNE